MRNKFVRPYGYSYASLKPANFRILFVLITLLLGVFVRSAKAETPLDLETVRLAILESIRQNEDKLTCGVLHWSRHTKEDEFMRGRKVETQGSYSLFWDGKKIATQYEHEMARSLDNAGDFEIVKAGARKAFDGKEFRQVPNIEKPKDIAVSHDVKFNLHENWFEIIGWYGKNLNYEILSKPEKFDHVKYEAFAVDTKDGKLIKIVGTVKETQERTIRYFDPAKNNSLVLEQWYNSEGQIRVEFKYIYKEVAEDVWMPVEKDSKSINPKTQKVKLHHHFKLDMDRSSFNDRSKIPEEVFHIPITPNMEISDYRGGVRINYKQDITPLVTDVLEEMVDDFINETEDTPGTTVTSSANETDQNNAVVQIRPPVSDPPKVLLQYETFRKTKRIVCWVAIVAGIVFMSFAVYGWRRKKKSCLLGTTQQGN